MEEISVGPPLFCPNTKLREQEKNKSWSFLLELQKTNRQLQAGHLVLNHSGILQARKLQDVFCSHLVLLVSNMTCYYRHSMLFCTSDVVLLHLFAWKHVDTLYWNEVLWSYENLRGNYYDNNIGTLKNVDSSTMLLRTISSADTGDLVKVYGKISGVKNRSSLKKNVLEAATHFTLG